MTEGKERQDEGGSAGASTASESVLRAIFASEPHGIFVVDALGRVVEVNPAGVAIAEVDSREALLGRRFTVFFDGEGRERAENALREAFRGTRCAVEVRFVGREGGQLDLNTLFVPLAPTADAEPRALILAHDVTEERRARRELEKSEERLRTYFERNLAASYLCRADGEILRCNASFADLFGFETPEAAIGVSFWSLFANPADREEFLERLRHRGDVSLEEGAFLRCDGVALTVLENAVGSFSAEGELREITGFMIDVTELRKKDEILTQLLFNDALTGLPNRRLFLERLEHELDRQARGGYQVAVLTVGLDRFSPLNQALGHAVGDRVLVRVSEEIVECIRRSDTVGRLGGDLFGIVLPDVAREEDPAAVAAKLLEVFGASFRIDEHEVYTGASVGIALAPTDGTTASDLLKFAEMAMKRAKEEGGRKYRFFRQEMDMQILERQLLETSLRKAVERGELELHFQPQLRLEDGVLVGAEALVRWRHPDMGLVYPSDFIGLAEETGLILQLGEWVLYEACQQARVWRDGYGRDLRVAVNLSPRQFRQRDLVETVEHALASSGLPPSCLELEVTENVLMEDLESHIEKLERLRELGLGLAIDDFGTGYSSLIYLKRNFPVDALKIDRGFLRDLAQSPDDRAIVEAILAMGHALGLRLVAEGVETEEQRVFLQERACHIGQGFLFGRPIPAGDFEQAFLRS